MDYSTLVWTILYTVVHDSQIDYFNLV